MDSAFSRCSVLWPPLRLALRLFPGTEGLETGAVVRGRYTAMFLSSCCVRGQRSPGTLSNVYPKPPPEAKGGKVRQLHTYG